MWSLKPFYNLKTPLTDKLHYKYVYFFKERLHCHMSRTTMLSQIHLSAIRIQNLSDAKSYKTYEKVVNDLRSGKKKSCESPMFCAHQRNSGRRF